LAATAAGLAAAEVTAHLAECSSLVDAGAKYVIDKIPVPIVELGVRLLRDRDKPLLRTVVPLSALGIGTAASRLPSPAPEVGLLGLAAAGALAARRIPPRRPWAPAAAGAVVAVVTRRLVSSRLAAATLTALGLAALGAVRLSPGWRKAGHERRAAALHLAIGQRLPPSVDGAEGWGHPTPLFTPVDDFYRTDVNFGVPLVDPGAWRLKVRGLVHNSVDLGWDELIALGTTEFDSVMVCIHNDTDGRWAGNVRLIGIPLERVAALAGPSNRVAALETRAVDGYTITLPAGLTADGRFPGYVVVGMNGRVLSPEHGFPARAFVPGLFGQFAGAKWLAELVFAGERQPDYWGARGWPAKSVGVVPQARIDTPVHRAHVSTVVEVAGVAWAPPSGVAAVEVAVDDGPWQRAEIAGELAPLAWRRWRCGPLDLGVGSHRLRARAVAVDGTVQEGRPRPYYPVGVGGYHIIKVRAGRGQTGREPTSTVATLQTAPTPARGQE
jgi:DMSO/TMAO reductase YedYZ molybdopterin-dependent catalytic subunit